MSTPPELTSSTLIRNAAVGTFFASLANWLCRFFFPILPTTLAGLQGLLAPVLVGLFWFYLVRRTRKMTGRRRLLTILAAVAVTFVAFLAFSFSALKAIRPNPYWLVRSSLAGESKGHPYVTIFNTNSNRITARENPAVYEDSITRDRLVRVEFVWSKKGGTGFLPSRSYNGVALLRVCHQLSQTTPPSTRASSWRTFR